MTDKATIELTAPVTGIIKMVACEEGDMLAVGADLVIFETEDVDADEEEGETEEKPTASAPSQSKGAST